MTTELKYPNQYACSIDVPRKSAKPQHPIALPCHGSPAGHGDAVEEKALGHLINHIRCQHRNENAGREGENVPAVVADIHILRQKTDLPIPQENNRESHQ